jgi:AcrR family transcriptional regulator
MGSPKKPAPELKIPEALFFQVFDVKPGKHERKKIEILEAAIVCLAEVGFDRMTFEAIGKLTGMQRAHVNYYFSTRDDIMKSAVRYAVAIGQSIIIEHVQKAKGWKNKLRVVVEGPFEWLERYPKHASVMTILYHMCTYDPEYRKLQGEVRAGGEARLLACFEELIQEKKVTRKRALENARAIQAVMTGNILYGLSCEFPLSFKELKAWTVKLAIEMALL